MEAGAATGAAIVPEALSAGAGAAADAGAAAQGALRTGVLWSLPWKGQLGEWPCAMRQAVQAPPSTVTPRPRANRPRDSTNQAQRQAMRRRAMWAPRVAARASAARRNASLLANAAVGDVSGDGWRGFIGADALELAVQLGAMDLQLGVAHLRMNHSGFKQAHPAATGIQLALDVAMHLDVLRPHPAVHLPAGRHMHGPVPVAGFASGAGAGLKLAGE
jgi:hypothetical protein